MSKVLSALMMVLCLSLFGAPAANAFASPADATFSVDGDGKKKGKGKKKHKKHGKKHGKKKQAKKKKDNKK